MTCARREFVSMLLEKGSSAQRGRFAVPGLVPLDGGFCDINAQYSELRDDTD